MKDVELMSQGQENSDRPYTMTLDGWIYLGPK